MTIPTVDVAIAYRVYPRVSATPALHADDKFKLVEVCLSSFKRALGRLRIKMWVLLDGCPPAYEQLFRSYFSNEEIEFVHLSGIGNKATFAMQIDLLATQSMAALVYFAEDDYFYLDDAMVELVNFARQGSRVDFITPYDHPDRYNDSTRNQPSQIQTFGNRHWRTTSSTCLTFLASRNALIANRSLFKRFRHGADDCAIWQAITQKASLLDLRVHATTLDRFKIWANTWRLGYKTILFGRTSQLWSPVPSLGTHMALPYLAPAVDWYSKFERGSGINAPTPDPAPQLGSSAETGCEWV